MKCAECLMLQNKFSNALKNHLAKAAELMPKTNYCDKHFAKLYCDMAECYALGYIDDLDNVDCVIRNLEKSLDFCLKIGEDYQLITRSPVVMNKVVDMLYHNCLKTGHHSKAIEYLERVLMNDNGMDPALLHSRIAFCQKKQNLFSDAIKSYMHSTNHYKVVYIV
jgi:hypothetical protein